MHDIDWSKYVERVFGWSYRRTGNHLDAEELTQSILLTALESLDSLRNPEAFRLPTSQRRGTLVCPWLGER